MILGRVRVNNHSLLAAVRGIIHTLLVTVRGIIHTLLIKVREIKLLNNVHIEVKVIIILTVDTIVMF